MEQQQPIKQQRKQVGETAKAKKTSDEMEEEEWEQIERQQGAV